MKKCMKICQKQVFLCQKIQLFFIMKHTTVSFNNIFFQRMIVSLVPSKKCQKKIRNKLFVNSNVILKITIVCKMCVIPM